MRQRGTAESAGQHRHSRDADLQAGKKPRRIIGQDQSRAGTDMSARCQPLQVAATRRYDGKLAHGQVAIEQNKDRNHDDFKRGHFGDSSAQPLRSPSL